MKSTFILSLLILSWPRLSHSYIQGYNFLDINLTNAADASTKATWANKLMVSEEGLGWTYNNNGETHGWIQTQPLAVGQSWRVPISVQIVVTVRPMPPDDAAVFVRYSPDLKNWSSWQTMQGPELRRTAATGTAEKVHVTRIQVPEMDRRQYGELLREYAQQDVPWRSDEEAAVKWILAKHPQFFKQHIPFIGYIQVLIEGGWPRGRRVTGLRTDVSWTMSGMSVDRLPPEAERERYGPWRFEAAP